jgi:hypothetical protein
MIHVTEPDSLLLDLKTNSTNMENLPVLCTMTDKTVAESPQLAIYCIIIALIWLVFIITICFGQIRKLIEKVFQNNEHSTNRGNTLLTQG